MGSHASRVLPSSPVWYGSVLPSDVIFKISVSDQSEFYYPDENENINSHEEIHKKRRFVIESDED